MAGLTVKIDPVAVLRGNRESRTPDPVAAALMAEMAGADGIAVHFRQDRRYIQDRDVRLLRHTVQSKLILEMNFSSEMVGVALDIKPELVTLVPEKREQFNEEGGLDLIVHRDDIAETIATLQNSGIPVGVLVDPDPEQVKLAHSCGAALIEIHTGTFCEGKSSQKRHQAFARIVDCLKLAHRLKLGVRAGGKLDYKSIKAFKGTTEIDEFSIGHSIIARAVLTGMQAAVREMIGLIRTLE